MSASVKALTEDPYSNIDKKYKVGEFQEGLYRGLWTMVALLE